MKLAPDGTTLWEARPTPEIGHWLEGAAVLADGRLLLVGDTDADAYADDPLDGWLLAYAADGKPLWEQTYPSVNWRGAIPRADGTVALYGQHHGDDGIDLWFQLVGADGKVTCPTEP
jgi:hypothetical protein